MRNLIIAIALALAACNTMPEVTYSEVHGYPHKDTAQDEIDPELQALAGAWLTTHVGFYGCSYDYLPWAALELRTDGTFTANSVGFGVNRGVWHGAVVDLGDSTTEAAFLEPTDPMAYTVKVLDTQLNSADGLHLGGIITLQYQGENCSYNIVMERVN
jgi:hypothetical protein